MRKAGNPAHSRILKEFQSYMVPPVKSLQRRQQDDENDGL
jgi:hypothetical protein